MCLVEVKSKVFFSFIEIAACNKSLHDKQEEERERILAGLNHYTPNELRKKKKQIRRKR